MRRLAVLLASILCGACSRGAPSPPTVDARDARAMWLCGPGHETCEALGARTEIFTDGGAAIATGAPAAARSPDVDCFYVYPTVDMAPAARNESNIDRERVRRTAVAQVARMRDVCTLWIPLYRQVSIGTYFQPHDVLENGLAIAYADVERAFREYLKVVPADRRVVLIGHSQGAEMVARLLRKFFDGDAAMTRRLVLAMPIGGQIDVRAGDVRGGTFTHLPLCTKPREVGCVVAYRTYAKGELVDPDRWAPPAGQESACVNPAALDEPARRRLRGALFPVRPDGVRWMRNAPEVTTPFVTYPDFFSAECVAGRDGYRYLAIAVDPAPGDARKPPFDFSNRAIAFGKLGLHVLDLQLASGDLVDMIARRTGGSAAGP